MTLQSTYREAWIRTKWVNVSPRKMYNCFNFLLCSFVVEMKTLHTMIPIHIYYLFGIRKRCLHAMTAGQSPAKARPEKGEKKEWIFQENVQKLRFSLKSGKFESRRKDSFLHRNSVCLHAHSSCTFKHLKQFAENYFIVLDNFPRIKWYFRIECCASVAITSPQHYIPLLKFAMHPNAFILFRRFKICAVSMEFNFKG